MAEGFDFSAGTDAVKSGAVFIDGAVFDRGGADIDLVDSFVELFPCNPGF